MIFYENPQFIAKNAYLWNTIRCKDKKPQAMNTDERHDLRPAFGHSAETAPASRPADRGGRSRFPSPGDLAVMVLLTLGAQFAVGIALQVAKAAGAPLTIGGKTLFLSYFISMSLSIFAVLVYRSRRGGKGRWARFSFALSDIRLAAFGLVALTALSVVLEPLLALLPEPPVPADASLWGIATTVVLAPLFEETLCRGIVLKSALARHGVMWGWLLSALFFGLIHLYPAAVIYASAAGLVLGYAALRGGSLTAPVLLHAAHNATSLFLLLRYDNNATLRGLLHNDALYAAAWTAMLAVTVFCGRKIVLWIRGNRFPLEKGIEE